MRHFKSVNRTKRYEQLMTAGFTAKEALPLSKAVKTDAWRAMVAYSKSFLERFNHYAHRMQFTPQEARREYRIRRFRMYQRHGWLVKEGPKGAQKGPQKGQPSPFAMLRSFERAAPPLPPGVEKYRKERKRRLRHPRGMAQSVAELRERQRIRSPKGSIR